MCQPINILPKPTPRDIRTQVAECQKLLEEAYGPKVWGEARFAYVMYGKSRPKLKVGNLVNAHTFAETSHVGDRPLPLSSEPRSPPIPTAVYKVASSNCSTAENLDFKPAVPLKISSFDVLDTNKDGVIDRAEYKGGGQTVRISNRSQSQHRKDSTFRYGSQSLRSHSVSSNQSDSSVKSVRPAFRAAPESWRSLRYGDDRDYERSCPTNWSRSPAGFESKTESELWG